MSQKAAIYFVFIIGSIRSNAFTNSTILLSFYTTVMILFLRIKPLIDWLIDWMIDWLIDWLMTTFVIWNKELRNITNIVKSLKESSLLIKGVNETTENEAKEQKSDFVVFC